MREIFDYITDPEKLNARTKTLIHHANVILGQYQAQGFTLTLRQLYYQFVSRDLIPNLDHQYKMLGTAVGKGRMLGLLDWDMIEDRGRQATSWRTWDSVDQAVSHALRTFALDPWENQKNRVEVWVEKDALSEIVKRAAGQYWSTVMVNRGYSSLSAMKMAAERIIRNDNGGESVILYLGDHDPSGLDMVRDIDHRLDVFGAMVTVKHIALTMDQIDQYDPPPNPTKLSDTRARDYIREHGDSSWEVDALEPAVLSDLITAHIEDYVDLDQWDEDRAESERQKEAALKAIKDLDLNQGEDGSQ